MSFPILFPLIDVHTHLFPDEIAEQVVRKLAADAGISYYSDGTIRSLLAQMEESGVQWSVNQPVATRPEQIPGINKRVVELSRGGKSILSFGALHPLMPGVADEVFRLKENGIKGIKLHPDYQEFHPDDERLLPLYEACRQCGMIVFFHAGIDLAYPYTHGTPERFAQVLTIKGLKVVLAHMGGYRMWDEVEKYILGKEVYIETSFCHEIAPARLQTMLLAHGEGRILFGSDSPWGYVPHLRRYIDDLGLAPASREKLYFKNAEELLVLRDGPAST
jgi:predicted TIM-barrel fold metal-dependent hydrolase